MPTRGGMETVNRNLNGLKKSMSGWMETLRLSGDIITIIGAWYHSLSVVALGLVIILFAWLRGKIQI
jgi:hypothetical protein